jgi:DNA-binding NtrC family response regulator
MSTTVCGDLGSTTQVEISAAGDRDADPDYVGVLVRQARSTAGAAGRLLSGVDGEATKSLEQRIKASTEAIERRSIAAALGKSDGNRTAAAKLLGLSRQSLHTKLNKYELDEHRN